MKHLYASFDFSPPQLPSEKATSDGFDSISLNSSNVSLVRTDSLSSEASSSCLRRQRGRRTLPPKNVSFNCSEDASAGLALAQLVPSEWMQLSSASEEDSPKLELELRSLSPEEREQILEVMRRDTIVQLYTELKVR